MVNRFGRISTVVVSGVAGFNGDYLGPEETQLFNPSRLAWDNNDQTLIFADVKNYRIRTFAEFGLQVETIAGTGVAGYSGDGGAAVDAQLNHPTQVSVGRNGYIITDSGNHRIRMMNFGGEHVISTLAGNGLSGNNGLTELAQNTQLNNPQCAIYDAVNDIILVSDTRNNRVLTYRDSSKPMENFAGGVGDGLPADRAHVVVSSVATSKSGLEIHVTESSQNRIRKISQDGIISTVAGTGGYGFTEDGKNASSNPVATPSGIFLTNDDEILFVESGQHKVRKITRNGTLVTIAGTGFGGFGGDGGLAIKALLNNPTTVHMNRHGEIIICDVGNNRIRKVFTDGTITTIAGTGNNVNSNWTEPEEVDSLDATLNGPTGIFLTDDNHIYVADSGNSLLRKLTPYCESGHVLSIDNRYCLPVCFGVIQNDTQNVRRGHGNCTAPDTCHCTNQYGGTLCEIPKCFGIASDQIEVCSFSNGTCIAPDQCQCREGFSVHNAKFHPVSTRHWQRPVEGTMWERV